MLNPSHSAIEVFLQRSSEIDEAFTRLHEIISSYATLHSDDIEWRQVDELEHYIVVLNEISESTLDTQSNCLTTKS